MNVHRLHSRRGPVMAATVFGLLSAGLFVQRGTASDQAVSAPPPAAAAPASATPAPAVPPPDTAKAPAPAPSPAPAAPVPLASLPQAAMATATDKAPATLVIERQPADAYLDLNVRAFKPPKRGAVEAVVTLEENKEGGREVELGAFTIFPARKFEAKKPDDERGYRLNATQALADLGADGAAVRVKVRLAPLHEGHSATGAKLTLGKVQFVPRQEEPKEEPKEESK